MASYPTDLNDSQWQVIAPYLKDKRKRKYSYRALLNAVFYLVKTGCQRRMLPHDYPKWQSVYVYFSRWKRDGTLEQIQQALVEKERVTMGRKGEPTVGIIVKTTLVAGEARGFDAAKRVKGKKRHIVVDTLGLILAVVLQSASVQDRNGADQVDAWLKGCWCRVKVLFADGGYSGKLVERIRTAFVIEVRIVQKINDGSFSVLPKRWIVERTFAWLGTCRRNSKDYERLTETSQAMILASSIKLMLLKS